MPFTASHAVVALPFVRGPLPFGAVAVGAMTPDLPLFFPTFLSYEVTHGFPGVLLSSLPLAMLLYSVWRALLRPAASALLPRAVGERLPSAWLRTSAPTRGGLLRVVLALLIGVLTHVAWDLFTHPARFGSVLVPALSERWGPIDGTQWLQYASSLLGLAVLGIAAVFHLNRAVPAPVLGFIRVRLAYWLGLAVAALAGLVTAIATLGIPASTGAFKLFAFEAGTLAGALMLIATALAAGVVLIARRRSAGAEPVARLN